MIRLISICISSVSYTVLLNSGEFGQLNPHGGIRLGDPLSLYLFIICLELFSCILRDLQRWGRIHGIRVARSAPFTSHLFLFQTTHCYPVRPSQPLSFCTPAL
ncbi:uncharacterized mitochondrial protein atmg01250 [Phtheirospermum japonicum]|uniref:Uncharacterized mitochondrial protein atmg01250 n=1 Tax=Phtheirospermum japonicum TaxID=374723 RepID=A0A830CLH2_9LAMI|nr:uncharacterized mitochondrial protein atmg01250 [Phtheirospermum japonicum]